MPKIVFKPDIRSAQRPTPLKTLKKGPFHEVVSGTCVEEGEPKKDVFPPKRKIRMANKMNHRPMIQFPTDGLETKRGRNRREYKKG